MPSKRSWSGRPAVVAGQRRVRMARMITAMLAAVFPAAACHATGPRETTRPASAAAVRVLTAEESDVLDRSEQLLIRDCMRRRGFAYTIVSRTRSAEDRDFPYVVDDLG